MINAAINSSDTISRLINGEVGVMPTDTVYGLVARAMDKKAVERLYAIKNRQSKPGTLVAASIDQLAKLGVPRDQLKAVEQYWPGPISIVLSLSPPFAYLHQGVGTLAVRIPADPHFRATLEKAGPLQTTSANHPGAPGSVTIQEAIDYFGDNVDFYVDGGNLSGRPPSTVARLTPKGTLEVLRAGAFQLPTDLPH